MTAIKTCPFCGGEAGVHTLRNEHAEMFKVCCMGIKDTNCAGLGLDEYDDSESTAIAVWNKRG